MTPRKAILTETVALRLPPSLYRQVKREQEKGETLSDTVRRVLTEYFAMSLDK